MATSSTNYTRPRDNNYSKTKGSNYNKSGVSSFSKQKNNYSKPTDNNFRDNNYKNPSFRNNSYSDNEKTTYTRKQQASHLDSKKENEVDNDVFFEKLETQKRLERELKIKKRKDKKEETMPKDKKTNGKYKKLKNIDWTRGYEDGLFDEDEFYDDYIR